MTAQSYTTHLVSRTESSNRSTNEGELSVKGDSSISSNAESIGVISEPAGLPIPTPDRKVHRERSRKPSTSNISRRHDSYPAFRRLCDDLLEELKAIDSFFVGDTVSDEGAGIVIEVEELLERLYACPHGHGESLKKVVVALQSQVNNAQWDSRHVGFLRDAIKNLRVRYLVDDSAVDACYELMKVHHLDEFRGTISEPQVVKRYRIEEVKGNAESAGT